MAEMEEVINQAIADFDDIEAAIEEQGVDVPAGTDTKEYGNLIRSIKGVGEVDQSYNPDSSNAQSGTAVAEALAGQPIKIVKSPDADGNYLNLYDLESGMYVLDGRFYVCPNITKRFVFNRSLFVAVSHGNISTCVQVIYPPYNTIQYLNIYPPDEEAGTDYTYERKDAELYYMEDTRQKVTEINELSDDEHYPSAKAVYDAIGANSPIKRIESLDEANIVNLSDLETGNYVLYGYFSPYPDSHTTMTADNSLVNVYKVSAGSHIFCFEPLNAKVVFFEILVDDTNEKGYTYSRTIIDMLELNGLIDRVGSVEEKTNTLQEETSNALKGTASGEVIRIDDVNPIEHTVKAKVKGKNLFDTSPIQTQSANATYAYISGVSEGCIEVTTEEGYTGNGHCQTHVAIKTLCPKIEAGKQYVFSAETDSTIKMIHLRETDVFVYFGTPIIFTEEMIESTVGVYGLDARYDNTVVGTCKISNIQLEEGDTATEYTPYVDPSTVTVTRCGKNFVDAEELVNSAVAKVRENTYTITKSGTDRFSNYASFNVPLGKTVCLSGKIISDTRQQNTAFTVQVRHIDNSISYPSIKISNGKFFGVITANVAVSGMRIYIEGSEADNAAITFSNLQIEYGDTATEYESYKGVETYTPSADGTVNGITSVSPTMTLLTDKAGVTIEAEYNQDINAAFDKINAILETLLNGGA